MIRHESIVQLKETYESEKYLLIVMEQVSGGELYQHIKTYELEEREIAIIMFQLLQAIHYLHSCGIAHRDLKPENILVEKNPHTEEVTRIKIVDFGLSKISFPGEKMNEMCGTPAYVAPEILHRKGYDK
jgi:serine/threonine protein kinase